MESLDKIINGSKDVREVKRALSVKMVENGLSGIAVSGLLNVSPQYVSKWKGIYETQGAEGLLLGYQGGESYLKEEQREAIVDWIKSHETLSVEEIRDQVEAEYGVIYQSKQSYYDLLEAGGMSYHKSEKKNPKCKRGGRRSKKTGSRVGRHPGGQGDSMAARRMSFGMG